MNFIWFLGLGLRFRPQGRSPFFPPLVESYLETLDPRKPGLAFPLPWKKFFVFSFYRLRKAISSPIGILPEPGKLYQNPVHFPLGIFPRSFPLCSSPVD